MAISVTLTFEPMTL